MLPCLLMAVVLLPTLAACMYCWLPLSARMSVSPGFQAHIRPSLSVIMVWSLLAVIWLALAPSGRPTEVMLAVLLYRYQACPSASRRRNPRLRAWAWTMRMSGSCLTRAGLAFPVLAVSQVQACPSASTMRIRLPEATAVTACAFPGRLVAACCISCGF